MKRLRNFLTSFLVSVVVFCMPAYAEFTSVDSNNLSSIQIYVRSIDTGVNNVITSITNLSSYFNNLISSVGSLSNSLASYFDSYRTWYSSIDDSLDSIIDLISPSSYSSFLGSESILYFNQDYFTNVSVSSGSVSYNSDGIASVSGSSGSSLTLTYYSAYTSISLQPGEYYIILSSNISPQYVSSVRFSGYTLNSQYEIVSVEYQNLTSSTRGCSSSVRIRVSVPITTYGISFIFSSASDGTFYGGITRVSDDVIASDAINSDQEGMVSDVDDAGEQQSQQEDQMWQNINTYKGDISFNLDGWDDAAGGLSYVTGVFMIIWNNSPTQPIVLSLMLGIAMLSIGRGVMAAVRVSRNRGDD